MVGPRRRRVGGGCIDFQLLRLQELPEDLPPGQLPHYIDVTIRQDLVDNARPGDRIILTGIVRKFQNGLKVLQVGGQKAKLQMKTLLQELNI